MEDKGTIERISSSLKTLINNQNSGKNDLKIEKAHVPRMQKRIFLEIQ